MPTVKRLAILSLLDVFFISIATLMTPTAAMNQVMAEMAETTGGLWIVYWLPTVVYYLLVLLAFDKGARPYVSNQPNHYTHT